MSHSDHTVTHSSLGLICPNCNEHRLFACEHHRRPVEETTNVVGTCSHCGGIWDMTDRVLFLRERTIERLQE